MVTVSVQVNAGEESVAEHGLARPRRMLLVADVTSSCLAVLAMYAILRMRHTSLGQLGITVLMAALIIIGSLGLTMRAGQYTNRIRMSRLTDVGALVKSVVIAAASVTLLNYLTKGFFTGNATASRVAVGSFVLVFLGLGFISRLGLSTYQRRQFAHGHALSNILVLGTGRAAADFIEFLGKRPWLGVAPVGRLAYGAPSSAAAEDSLPGLPPVVANLTDSLDGLRDLDQAMRLSQAGEVVVALDHEEQAQLPRITSLLSLAHVPFKVVPSLFEQSYRAAELLGYEELPVIDVNVDPLDRVARMFKRAADLCVATAMLVLLLPLELLIVAGVAAESGFPVVFRQERVGKNGHRFQMLKFRTMVKDADEHLQELEAQNEAGVDGRLFKMRSDPRVTRVGAFLRALSLDELPQLINVIQGTMSIVGPRPPLPREVDKYEQQHLYRLKALPGITGLWQVSGRSDLSFDDMVKLDRYYLDNWSLRMDFSIMLRTVFVVVTRKGAY